jgi:hypothetical protein
LENMVIKNLKIFIIFSNLEYNIYQLLVLDNFH